MKTNSGHSSLETGPSPRLRQYFLSSWTKPMKPYGEPPLHASHVVKIKGRSYRLKDLEETIRQQIAQTPQDGRTAVTAPYWRRTEFP